MDKKPSIVKKPSDEIFEEAEKTAVLELLTYVDEYFKFEFEDGENGITIKDIMEDVNAKVEKMNDNNKELPPGATKAVAIINSYMSEKRNPDFGNIMLMDQSTKNDPNETMITDKPDWFRAYTFHDPAAETYYLAHSGTPSHAWGQNAAPFGPPRDNVYYTYTKNEGMMTDWAFPAPEAPSPMLYHQKRRSIL